MLDVYEKKKTEKNFSSREKNQWRNLDFGFQSLADSLSWILDSKVQDSGFHKKNIQGISDSKGQISRSAESGFPYMGRDVHF